MMMLIYNMQATQNYIMVAASTPEYLEFYIPQRKTMKGKKHNSEKDIRHTLGISDSRIIQSST